MKGQLSNLAGAKHIKNPIVLTWNGIVQAAMSQTLNVLSANLSREPTSHMLISPTFVPTTMKITVSHIIKDQQQIKLFYKQHFHARLVEKFSSIID